MKAGAIRHRVVVEEPILSQNATGEEEVSWALVGKVWAAVEPLKGRERLQAAQINAAMDTRIRIRWSEAMDRMNATWRLTHRAVVYNIVSIAHLNMARREIEIMATSGVNLG